MTADQQQPAGQGPAIEAFYLEHRTFPPPDSFVKEALITDDHLDQESAADLEGFWAEQATSMLDWLEPPQRTLTWELPFARWFEGGKLNVSYNCLDRNGTLVSGTRLPTTGRVSRTIGEPSPTRRSWRRSRSSPTCSSLSGWRKATGTPSTCR